MDLTTILDQENTLIIDVREPYEFENGHADGAINIPLSSVLQNFSEIESANSPVVVYCRSGRRSESAKDILKTGGISEVYNAGGFDDILFYQSQTQKNK